MTRPIDIRPLAFDEISTLISWAQAEGWNPGRHDADTFLAADPDAFLGIESQGILIGGGAVFKHNPQFGFMGLFIIRPEFRGQGLGRQLWYARRDHLRRRLHPACTIGMDGVSEMVPFYSEGGFRAAYRHLRFEYSGETVKPESTTPAVALAEFPRSQLDNLDRLCFPGPRQGYLDAWLRQPDAYALGLSAQGDLSGYGVMRRCQTGWKIGPLLAATRSAAEALMAAFIGHADTEPVYLDVPENNAEALKLCGNLKMTEIFSCTRMYFGSEPDLDFSRLFGITSLEAG